MFIKHCLCVSPLISFTYIFFIIFGWFNIFFSDEWVLYKFTPEFLFPFLIQVPLKQIYYFDYYIRLVKSASSIIEVILLNMYLHLIIHIWYFLIYFFSFVGVIVLVGTLQHMDDAPISLKFIYYIYLFLFIFYFIFFD